MQFSLADIRKALDEAAYSRGVQYAQDHRVLAVQQEGDTVIGKVRGSGHHVYTQQVRVFAIGNRLAVNGHCSCPVGYNCKHVAAVLAVQALMQKKSDPARSAEVAIAPAMRMAKTKSSAPPVPPAIASWLLRLDGLLADSSANTEAQASAAASKAAAFCLMFMLIPAHDGRRISLLPCKVRQQPNGEVGAAEPIRDFNRLIFDPPAYFLPRDEEFLRLFGALHGSHHSYDAPIEPGGKIGAQLLGILLEEKRLLWANSVKDAGKGLLHPLRAAARRRAKLAWVDYDDRLRLEWQYDMDDAASPAATSRLLKIDHVLPTDPPWYIDNLSCGELILPHTAASMRPQALLTLVTQTPLLEHRDAAAVSQQLLLRGLQQWLPLPAPVEENLRTDIRPVIILRLGSTERAVVQMGRPAQKLPLDFALLRFSYEGEEVSAFGLPEDGSLVRTGPHGIERIQRNQALEQETVQRLNDLGFVAVPASGLPAVLADAKTLPSQSGWLAFVREQLPLLQQQGWHIDKLDSYRFDLTDIDDWYASVEETPGSAWFDLELGIVVNQERVSLLPVLVDLIRSAPETFYVENLVQQVDSEHLLVALPNGIRTALPWGRIKPILQTLSELYLTEEAEPRIRLSSLDAARLAELEDSTRLRWMGGEKLRSIGEKLHCFGGVRQLEPPSGLRASLRDYQRDGLAWMQFLREYELAGILADDMGLGKTIQTLAHILTEKEAGRLTNPALVVAPTSLMANWQDEAARFAPDLRVLTLQGKERLAQFDQIDAADLVLTTYSLLPRDEARLRRHDFHLVILDEAHYIKNNRSKAAQTAGLLRARHRLCLTGTPLENHLGELWSQFHFLLPGLLGDEKSFNTEFRMPIEKRGDEYRRALLAKRIRPFMLRRTKDKVAGELPPKTEMVRMVELNSAQRDLYETVRLAMDQKIRAEIAEKGVARSQIVILDALLKLRQVCCDPRLVKADGGKHAATSAKLEELMVMLDTLRDDGRRVLVFSQFTSMLALIEQEVQRRGYRYAVLTGDTDDRAGAVRAFQSGEVELFLVSLKAGGVGLNLTAADTVIHYDPWWNPAAELQATDRAWRIGQDKPVFVYKLIAKGTLEEKIQLLQQRKADLAQAILNDGAASNLKLTQEDLQEIFAPLKP